MREFSAELPRHIQVTLYQLLSLSNLCNRDYAGEIETCPREFSRSVVGAIINVRENLPPDVDKDALIDGLVVWVLKLIDERSVET